MKITKLGHCCLVIEHKGIRVMTDPGMYSMLSQEQEKNIDIILITHEHQDHLHVSSVKKIIENNTDALIITNTAVSEILAKEGIGAVVLDGDKEENAFSGILFQSFPGKHAEIFEEIGQVQNTGYMIDGEFFYPGDAFTDPQKKIKVLALPVCGPWMALREAITYAKKVKPEFCFNVHDGYLSDVPGSMISAPKNVLDKENIKYIYMNQGEPHTFNL